MKNKKTIIKFSVLGVVLVGVILGAIFVVPEIPELMYGDYKAANPILSKYVGMDDENEMTKGDFYVSTKGSDSNSGSKDAPFLTVEKAIETVRKEDKTGKNGITVCIEAGEYNVSSLEFTKEDSGTKACPVTYCSYNGEVVINGGKNIEPSLFTRVTDENV